MILAAKRAPLLVVEYRDQLMEIRVSHTYPGFNPLRLLATPARVRGLTAVGAWWRVGETRDGGCCE